jgi:hypothetical protein
LGTLTLHPEQPGITLWVVCASADVPRMTAIRLRMCRLIVAGVEIPPDLPGHFVHRLREVAV